ncbi:hypothetical protein K435DRAFT_762209 [Dendrothele bispora CBS 962.96]|uniref:Uncharacterized protein n=1 Tax=Dendrothele bispora (strain CBS 962.96) TaxID=1314807 RepID=A0A4S8LG30_DENBC|nr:hypothetical protein K435DRAFT_762209 [Dendrothele bispora CBS 962.96]
MCNKGKGRALEPTERTPLLDRASGSSSPATYEPTEPVTSQRRRLLTHLFRVFLLTLSLCIVAILVVLLLAWSYTSRSSELSPQDVINKALVFEGPQHIDVLNITWSEGMWVNVQGRVGVDAGAVVGVNSNEEDSFLERIWKSIGRWGVRRLDRVSVTSSTINVTAIQDDPPVLASIDIPSLELPLTTDPPSDSTWLKPFSTPVFIRPTTNVSDLLRFAREAWKQGAVRLETHISEVDVRGGDVGEHGWRAILHRQLSNVNTTLRIKIPVLPGLPNPGNNMPFPSLGDMITLRSFDLASVQNNLTIQASATVVDPAPPSFNLTTPTLPFIISLPTNDSSIPIATVSTKSFSLTHPNITLDISGHVLSLPIGSSSTLSTFLSRYLSAKPNPILISTPLLPDFNVNATFPAPNPRPHILRNVSIHNMKLKALGTSFLASGEVQARVILPKGMNIDLDVKHVLPDVMVFDGEVPEIVYPNPSTPGPSPPPLPDPLPEKAFGRIRPDDWLDSTCVAVPTGDNEGSAFNVSATIVDVPLQVLPGRQKEFGDFVSKVIFGSEGATAGILGNAAVKVLVEGLPFNGPGAHDGVELGGLPFKGSVKIGKKNLFTDFVSHAMQGFDTWHKN